jgi:hypothetical protein
LWVLDGLEWPIECQCNTGLPGGLT